MADVRVDVSYVIISAPNKKLQIYDSMRRHCTPESGIKCIMSNYRDKIIFVARRNGKAAISKQINVLLDRVGVRVKRLIRSGTVTSAYVDIGVFLTGAVMNTLQLDATFAVIAGHNKLNTYVTTYICSDEKKEKEQRKEKDSGRTTLREAG